MKNAEIYTFDNKKYIAIDRINEFLYLSNLTNHHDMMIRKVEPNDEEMLLPLETDEEFEKALNLIIAKKLASE